jgi:hypothetical protein
VDERLRWAPEACRLRRLPEVRFGAPFGMLAPAV